MWLACGFGVTGTGTEVLFSISRISARASEPNDSTSRVTKHTRISEWRQNTGVEKVREWKWHKVNYKFIVIWKLQTGKKGVSLNMKSVV